MIGYRRLIDYLSVEFPFPISLSLYFFSNEFFHYLAVVSAMIYAITKDGEIDGATSLMT